MVSRDTITEAIMSLFRYTTNSEMEQFGILYDIAKEMEGTSLQKRKTALLKHLTAKNTDNKLAERIVVDLVNEELKITQKDIWSVWYKDEDNFEKKYPKLYELLLGDGFSIVDDKLQNINIIEVVRHNKTEMLELTSVGDGSYADVYSFEDPYYKQIFALKRAKGDLNEKEIIRFKREYTELKKLDSPYIVKVYHYDDEKREYTMELMDHTLFDYIRKNKSKLTASNRISIIQQIFKAFIYIHSKNLLHRDISYTNVLIKVHDDGTVIAKVSDFGLVKIPDSTLTDDDSKIKGSLNDPNLAQVGYKNYNVGHEIYVLAQLINFVLTGDAKGGLYKRKMEIHDYLAIGYHAEITKRFTSVEQMSNEFQKIKSLIK